VSAVFVRSIFHGNKSSIWLMGCCPIRFNTAVRYSLGLIPFSLAVPSIEYITAARWPPDTEPANR